MKNKQSIAFFWENYSALRNDFFYGRYLSLESIEKTLLALPDFFNLKIEGFSVNRYPIRSVRFGDGEIKILMWSQMHGNETTTTKAVFDLLKTFENRKQSPFLAEIFSECTIKIIPVLNPDGAANYTRENANGIDLNRDAENLSQPESRILDDIFHDFHPDFCFNLHDQRSIYGAGDENRPAVLSFLAPSFDEEKAINRTRETAMEIIAEVNNFLEELIPEKIGRYDDAFNINCVGDKFQSKGVPTVLFEAGHFPEDYQREITRKLVYLTLLKTLETVLNKNYSTISLSKYWAIPENKKSFFDIIIRNVSTNGILQDIGIQFKEELDGNIIEFVPFISKIGSLKNFYGHKELNGEKQLFTVNGKGKVQIETEIKNIKIGSEEILLKLNHY